MSASTPTTRPLAVLAAVLLAGAALVGCTTPAPEPEPSGSPTPSETVTETPEPEPTRPALADLVLTPEGLGTIVVGQGPDADPATSMVRFDAAECAGAGLWVTDPTYAATPVYGPAVAFAVGGTPALVNRIDLYSTDIATDGGVRIGSTRAELVAAHPGAAVVPQILTEVYVVPGTAGDLHIELAAIDAGYWGAEYETVRYIRAVVAGTAPYSVAASENVLGVCGA